MAKATKKNHYYILVFSNHGPVYVTSVDYHTCEWDWSKPPMEFSKAWAEDIVNGLRMNLHNAVLVHMPYEIDSQPYYYKEWQIEFKERSEEDADN